MDKPETVATLGTQDKHKHNTTQKTKEGTQVFMKRKQLLSLSYKTPTMLLIYI